MQSELRFMSMQTRSQSVRWKAFPNSFDILPKRCGKWHDVTRKLLCIKPRLTSTRLYTRVLFSAPSNSFKFLLPHLTLLRGSWRRPLNRLTGDGEGYCKQPLNSSYRAVSFGWSRMAENHPRWLISQLRLSCSSTLSTTRRSTVSKAMISWVQFAA